MPKFSVSMREKDLAEFIDRAEAGEFSLSAALPLASVYAAVRHAQRIHGDEQLSIDAFLAIFTPGSGETLLALIPKRSDMAPFERMVARGELAPKSVKPLALVFSAMRKAQELIGPGHSPLDIMFAALPSSYGSNWLRKKGVKA